MNIHLDTGLLIREPRWELLPAGDHQFFVSALVYAELSEQTVVPDPEAAATSGLRLLDAQSLYGPGLAFGDGESRVYRELLAATTSDPEIHISRGHLMIAAVAAAHGALLGTRNPAAYLGLDRFLQVIEL